MPRAHRHPVEPDYVGPPMRLHKLLARAGKGSRRACEELIAEGRVRVDGEVVSELGASVDPATAIVDVDGEAVHIERTVYYLLHKPQGFICTNEDDLGRNDRLAIDLLPPHTQRLYTVGRLDKDSEGLIVVTNDGDFTNKITHPRYQIPKTYRAVVRDTLSPEDVEKLQSGVWLAEGKTQSAQLRILKNPRRGRSCSIEVTLREGKNREVRRIFARLGHPVSKLTRVAIGPIGIGEMKPGESRKLEPVEVEALLASGSPPPKPKRKKGVAARTLAGDKPGESRPASEIKSRPSRKPSRKKTAARKSDGPRSKSKSKSKSKSQSRSGDAPRSRKPSRTKQPTRGRRADGDEQESRGGRAGTGTANAKRAGGPRPGAKAKAKSGGKRATEGGSDGRNPRGRSQGGRPSTKGTKGTKARGAGRPGAKSRSGDSAGSRGHGAPTNRSAKSARPSPPRRRGDDEFVG